MIVKNKLCIFCHVFEHSLVRESPIYSKVFICRIISPSQSLFADGGFTWLI